MRFMSFTFICLRCKKTSRSLVLLLSSKDSRALHFYYSWNLTKLSKLGEQYWIDWNHSNYGIFTLIICWMLVGTSSSLPCPLNMTALYRFPLSSLKHFHTSFIPNSKPIIFVKYAKYSSFVSLLKNSILFKKWLMQT